MPLASVVNPAISRFPLRSPKALVAEDVYVFVGYWFAVFTIEDLDSKCLSIRGVSDDKAEGGERAEMSLHTKRIKTGNGNCNNNRRSFDFAALRSG
jgi:hypothetical protein